MKVNFKMKIVWCDPSVILAIDFLGPLYSLTQAGLQRSLYFIIINFYFQTILLIRPLLLPKVWILYTLSLYLTPPTPAM